RELGGIKKNIKVAVMGCEVNGPGEAKDADVGIAGGRGGAVLFKKGEIIRRISEDSIVKELLNEIKGLE
ncbi:MAG TPA: flavodoxin-dependent (E)-4-hydroxy-3-methylbut-2-enyl-diphosphate synthase, partial [Clostridia bacterium]